MEPKKQKTKKAPQAAIKGKKIIPFKTKITDEIVLRIPFHKNMTLTSYCGLVIGTGLFEWKRKLGIPVKPYPDFKTEKEFLDTLIKSARKYFQNRNPDEHTESGRPTEKTKCQKAIVK